MCLHVKLLSSRVGCYIGDLCVGAVTYTVDLVFLAPSAASMRRELAVCDDYARDFHVSFDAAKSKCMIFSPVSGSSQFSSRYSLFTFYIVMQVTENVTNSGYSLHLGHLLTNDLDETTDITWRRNSSIR